MSGMMILETYKDDFPKTYVVAEKMFYKEHGVPTNKDCWDERRPLEDAAEAMLQIMKNLYIMKVPNQANAADAKSRAAD